MLYQEMNVFTRREELLCISVYSVFTWKEKSQGISVDSTNDGNNCTTKKVNWKQTERQTDLLCEFLQRNTDLNYTLLSKKVGGGQDQITISGPLEIMTSLEGGMGMKNQCHYLNDHFRWYFHS